MNGPVPQPPQPPVDLPPDGPGHGTFTAYQRHKCRCETCQVFARRYAKRYAARRKRKPLPDDHPGSVRSYNYGCRCEDCKAARRSYDRERWELKRR